MHAVGSDFDLTYPISFLPVVLDGILLGYLDPKIASNFTASLRKIKVLQNKTDELHGSVPMTLEIAYLPPGSSCGGSSSASTASSSDHSSEETSSKERNYYFPGVFMSSQVSRLVRPVQNLTVGAIEWIGPLEQIALSIATLEEDIRPHTTHQEISPLNVLSIIASTIPFCNYNQSPRNMYQCQMAK